jgi:hypothetical protein
MRMFILQMLHSNAWGCSGSMHVDVDVLVCMWMFGWYACGC